MTVICGGWQRDPDDERTIVNPTALVEVLSPSTEAYDRGEKLEHYKRIPSLRACLLVAVDRREIETWTRDHEGDPWRRALVVSGHVADVAALAAKLDVDMVSDDAKEPS